MFKLQYLLCIGLLFSVAIVSAQTRVVQGRVSSALDQTPIPDATVSIKNSNAATTTAADGTFRLSVPAGPAVLVISSVGFAEQEVAVSTSTQQLSIDLVATSQQLNEVVVTALGITKSKKALSYSTQTVETKDLTKARETNIANSLSGRIAGVDIVRSSQGVGQNVRVVLRGDRSFGNSEALVIIDGIPGDLGTVNPDDVASMNVLKGASAAALYGSLAQNGAIIITTKKGTAGKPLTVSLNSSFQLDDPVNLRDFQNVYGQGAEGTYLRNSEQAFGPKIAGQNVRHWSVDPKDSALNYNLAAHPDNWDNYYSNGKTFTNNISVTGGGEKIQSFFSYTNIQGTGIIDNNKFKRHNVNFRVSGNLTDKLSFDTKVTYFFQRADNFLRSDEDFSNVNRQIVRVPTNIDVNDLENRYEYINEDGELKQNYWNPGSNGGQNPYWAKNNVRNFFDANNLKGLASLTYKLLPSLSVMLRTGLTKNMNHQELRMNFDTYILANSGRYEIIRSDYTETNTDFLVMYNQNFGDFSLNANFGGNKRDIKGTELSSNATQLVNENVFTLSNAAQGSLGSDENYSQHRKNSLYASADIGFKSFLVATLTGRNDWSSTLPRDNWSYGYGSAGISFILSEAVTLPSAISFFKLRGSVSQTGNDAAAYLTREYFSVNPGGSIAKSNTNPVDTLKPEITTSQEYGFDYNMFENRVGLEFTWYKSNSKNQLINVATPPASGYQNKFINAGNVQNTGIEIALNVTPIRRADFTWLSSINYAKNDNKVISIAENSPEFQLRNDFINQTKIVEGRPFGEMYSRGYERNDAGAPIVQDNGLPLLTGPKSVYLGNSRAKWNGGFYNRFTLKDFSLSFLVTARMGGRITSFTDANIDGDGMTARTLNGREGFTIDGVRADGSKNDVSITSEQFWNHVGGRNTPAGEFFTYDASNIRLREVVLSYNLPEATLSRTFIKGASLSLTGRNLFFFMNKAEGFDPELVVSTDRGSIGTESFCPPFSRTIGLNLNLNF